MIIIMWGEKIREDIQSIAGDTYMYIYILYPDFVPERGSFGLSNRALDISRRKLHKPK